jgi:peptidoglycan/LPS O-acetylase OafA/YrhL
VIVSAGLKTPEPTALENKSYYRADIDGLRGVAVGLVVLYHLFPGVFKKGFLGVDVFFVISGYVVTQALERDFTRGRWDGLARFYARRVRRILPALYFNVAATVVLCALLIPPPDLRSIFKTGAAAVVGASNIALLYARFDYFSPDLSLNPFVQTWSLGVEEQFYLIFPALLMIGGAVVARARRSETNRLLALLATSSLIYWVYLNFHAPVSSFYNPLARFWELLFGALLALNREFVATCVGDRAWSFAPYLSAGFFAIGLLPSPALVPWDAFGNLFVVCGAALAIASGLNHSEKKARLLGSRPLVLIGKISYSLYLWHYTVLTFMRWNADLSRFPDFLAALLLIASISYASYRFIETPFRYAPE